MVVRWCMVAVSWCRNCGLLLTWGKGTAVVVAAVVVAAAAVAVAVVVVAGRWRLGRQWRKV